MEVLLSIITPCYNSVDFIESCLQNVIDQKCPEAEHLIIDGGSTDGTVELIKKYAEKYPHIRYVSEKDNGQSDAMNKGIRLAKGEVIGFLNADDAYFTFTLNRTLALFKANPNLNFVAGNCKLFDLQGNLLYINRPQRLKPHHLFSYLEPFPINPAAYFYKKKIHDKVGFYNTENHYNMDYEFILKAVLHFDLVYFNEDWGIMMNHEGAKTAIDSASNELASRKKRVYERAYSELTLELKLKVLLYKAYRFIIKS